jgi:NAD(P)-dependent dehydrogenase (short-subunit alcohol dehydrogenase family)
MTKADRRSVFITGASSGIGRACATRLARAGFRVFASVRRSKDHAPLGFADEGIEPVEMDVTDATSIAAAAARVGAALSARGLDGLVNNAGTGVSGPLEYVDLDVLRHEFEVDVFGQIAVTQAFLPLIRRARGRIVNMGSVGARLSMPFGGVLCGAKSAFGAMTDALRLELHPFGIHVCLVEPAAIRTPALDKTLGTSRASSASCHQRARVRTPAELASGDHRRRDRR